MTRHDAHTAQPTTLQDLRKAKGWKQADLARAAGITQNYLSDIERGRQPGSDALRLRLRAILEHQAPPAGKRRRQAAPAAPRIVPGMPLAYEEPPTVAAVVSPRVRAVASRAVARAFQVVQDEKAIGLDAVAYCVMAMERIYAAKSLDEARMVAGEMRRELQAAAKKLERTESLLEDPYVQKETYQAKRCAVHV